MTSATSLPPEDVDPQDAPAAPGPARPAPPSARDGFLDLVKTIAVVRVVVWHAFGAAALTYLVAAMPAMFFVSGSLFAASAARRGAGRTIVDRLRRIGPSLWAFAAVAWAAMVVAAVRTGTGLHWPDLVLWIAPVADPSGSVWEGGWLAAPLWYLRTLVWVLVLSPLILLVVRRSPWPALGGGLVLVAVSEVVHRLAGSPNLTWQVGDVVLFSWFFAAGAVAAAGGLDRFGRRQWLGIAGVAALLSGVWLLTQPVPLGVVNNSHPMHLFVGVVWLALALAAAPWLRRVAAGRAEPLVRFVGQRSLTIYLWNSAAIAVVLWALGGAGVPVSDVGIGVYLAAVAATVGVATVLFGWIEDLAARRRPRLWPLAPAAASRRPWWPPSPVTVAAVATVVAVLAGSGALARAGRDGTAEVAFRPPVPSQAPPTPVIAEPDDELVDARPAVAYRDGLFANHPQQGGLQELLDEWTSFHGLTGAGLAVLAPWGEPTEVVSGSHLEGSPRRREDVIDVMSVSKLFTANVVHRMAAVGLLDLDAPIPVLDAYPDFPHPQLTPRQLLTHRSGLANYWDTPRYEQEPLTIATPLDAVRAVAAEPLEVAPDTDSRYSSTNYLLLGLLVEQVVGAPFDELLRDLVLDPLAVPDLDHLPPEPGHPRGATGGIVGPLGELTVAVSGLLRDPLGLDPVAREGLFVLDPESGIGPGVNGFCPCTEATDGTVEWFGVGYTGGTTLALFLPAHDLVVALDLSETLWVDDNISAALELVEDLVAFDWSVPVVDDGVAEVTA